MMATSSLTLSSLISVSRLFIRNYKHLILSNMSELPSVCLSLFSAHLEPSQMMWCRRRRKCVISRAHDWFLLAAMIRLSSPQRSTSPDALASYIRVRAGSIYAMRLSLQD